MHAIEKIMARAAGLPLVRTGEIVNCRVDRAGINDLYLQTKRSFLEMGGSKVHSPDSVVMFLDHYAPASTVSQATVQKEFREFCAEQGIGKLMDVNRGVCHQVLLDSGNSRPGMVIVITDSHTTTHGAVGAFGTGVGATDLATILLTGKLWFRVPEIIRFTLNGTMPKGVYAKDVILKILGELKADYAVYKAVEFTGPAIAAMSMSERLCLCNMTTEMGAKAAYIQPDETTFAYLAARGVTVDPADVFTTDPDFVYAAEHTYDVSSFEPQVAAPFSVDNVADLSAHAGKRIDQAYIGACTGGRLEDIAEAARIVKGRKIAPHTRFIISPASRETLLAAIAEGYITDLVEAGATLVTPGCAACLGIHEGLIAEGERCISSTNRNFPGRMGHVKGEIFLASPAAVAASAVAGSIADPRQFAGE